MWTATSVRGRGAAGAAGAEVRVADRPVEELQVRDGVLPVGRAPERAADAPGADHDEGLQGLGLVPHEAVQAVPEGRGVEGGLGRRPGHGAEGPLQGHPQPLVDARAQDAPGPAGGLRRRRSGGGGAQAEGLGPPVGGLAVRRCRGSPVLLRGRPRLRTRVAVRLGIAGPGGHEGGGGRHVARGAEGVGRPPRRGALLAALGPGVGRGQGLRGRCVARAVGGRRAGVPVVGGDLVDLEGEVPHDERGLQAEDLLLKALGGAEAGLQPVRDLGALARQPPERLPERPHQRLPGRRVEGRGPVGLVEHEMAVAAVRAEPREPARGPPRAPPPAGGRGGGGVGGVGRRHVEVRAADGVEDVQGQPEGQDQDAVHLGQHDLVDVPRAQEGEQDGPEEDQLHRDQGRHVEAVAQLAVAGLQVRDLRQLRRGVARREPRPQVPSEDEGVPNREYGRGEVGVGVPKIVREVEVMVGAEAEDVNVRDRGTEDARDPRQGTQDAHVEFRAQDVCCISLARLQEHNLKPHLKVAVHLAGLVFHKGHEAGVEPVAIRVPVDKPGKQRVDVENARDAQQDVELLFRGPAGEVAPVLPVPQATQPHQQNRKEHVPGHQVKNGGRHSPVAVHHSALGMAGERDKLGPILEDLGRDSNVRGILSIAHDVRFVEHSLVAVGLASRAPGDGRVRDIILKHPLGRPDLKKHIPRYPEVGFLIDIFDHDHHPKHSVQTPQSNVHPPPLRVRGDRVPTACTSKLAGVGDGLGKVAAQIE